MASSASTSLNLELQTQGENDSTWGDKQKVNMTIIDAAIAGRTTVSLNGSDATLADVDYTLDAAKYAMLYTSDADQDDRAIVIPNAPRLYAVYNASGSYRIGVKTSVGTAVTVPAASVCYVACDGSNTCTFVSPLTNATTGAPNTASGAAASAVSVTPTGDLTSTDAQAALAELQGDIDAIEADLIANYQPLDTDLTTIAGLAVSKGAIMAGTTSAWSALSVGTNDYALVADSAQSAGVKWGVLAIAGGGTGATTASAARTALGVAVGSDVQAWDANLDQIAALAVTDGNIIVGNGSAWVAESGATARTSLGVAIGTDVQAYSANLTSLSAFALNGSGNWHGGIAPVGGDGVMEIGSVIDFHEADAGVSDYDYRLTSSSGVLSGSGNLSITGTITATDNITAYSDVSLKENIVTIPNGLEMVKAMRGCAYTMKAGGKPGIGVIAQEIEQVLPEVVETGPAQGQNPGMKSVAYGNIVAVLIEAIKDMEKQVIDIATELNVCQQRLNALEGNGL